VALKGLRTDSDNNGEIDKILTGGFAGPVLVEQNYEIHKEEYMKKYKLKNFTQFAGIFMINVFESKAKTNRFIVRLKEADFLWLEDEYDKRKEEYRKQFGTIDFDKFADLFIKELFEKLNQAKKILTMD